MPTYTPVPQMPVLPIPAVSNKNIVEAREDVIKKFEKHNSLGLLNYWEASRIKEMEKAGTTRCKSKRKRPAAEKLTGSRKGSAAALHTPKQE